MTKINANASAILLRHQAVVKVSVTNTQKPVRNAKSTVASNERMT